MRNKSSDASSPKRRGIHTVRFGFTDYENPSLTDATSINVGQGHVAICLPAKLVLVPSVIRSRRLTLFSEAALIAIIIIRSSLQNN